MSVRAHRIPENVSIRSLAGLLGVDERTIRRWQKPQDDKGDDAPRSPIPFTKDGTATLFPLKPCIAWFVEYRTSIASRSVSELDLARQRKVTADAELAELELAKVRGQLLPVDLVEARMVKIASTIRAQLLAAPGRYSPRLVGLSTLPEAQSTMDGIVRSVLNELADGYGGD